MKTVDGLFPVWTGGGVWPAARRAQTVVVLAGIGRSEIVDAALADPVFREEGIVLNLEADCEAPCDAVLWRLETAGGACLNQPSLLARHWHRPPYAITVRLVRYEPGSVEAEVLDEGTLGTRGPFAAFRSAVDRLAMRFVRDAARGCGRGPSGLLPADGVHGAPGWFDALSAKWHARLMTEWWSLGSAAGPVDQVLGGDGVGQVEWYRTKAGDRYLADPFPWCGTGNILCEEMPVRGGVGRIVSVSRHDGTLTPPRVILDDGDHHSYPCTLAEGDAVYCVPESTERGATQVHRLHDDGRLSPVCQVAPHARLADPTLFRWNGRYWLACTDLDLGEHDNLCLLHAASVAGPWTPHARWPVKIDIRGARPGGMVFGRDGRLFRTGQDCAATYGAAVMVFEIQTLTETAFRESVVAVLRPDRSGPCPHGLHTLVHDGERFWVDGKRFVLDLGLFRQKFRGRASQLLSGSRKG